jgi:hypothetical protein
MNKTLTSVLALAGLAAAAGAAQAADAVVAGDSDQPTLLTSTQMDAVTAGSNGDNLEAFAISFAKLVQIMERVDIQKKIVIDPVVVTDNSALAEAKGEADALGDNSHTETLALTTTAVVEGVGSSSSSIAESVSAATQDVNSN